MDEIVLVKYHRYGHTDTGLSMKCFHHKFVQYSGYYRYMTHIRLRSGLDVNKVILDENRAKMRTTTAIMMIQAAYHGYQP